ncbi:beta-1 [Perilla frutescens var. hirtella]|nr:beta-1 [Perilla frutescens var. frutescens]KAH6793886.1 beta-1 [Perilla frutescens var. hirtella]
MSASYRKSRMKKAGFVRLILIALLGVLLFLLLIRANAIVRLFTRCTLHIDQRIRHTYRNYNLDFKNSRLPRQNNLSMSLQKQNLLAPRNLDLYPNLAKDHIVIVLYVHNRPNYLRIVVDSLSRVAGINETLLIVSHDGYFEEMSKIVESIRFCLVKQIFAPYSPHIFPSSFPGVSSFDCKGKDDPNVMKCKGTRDQYGNHRLPRIVSLKHHWWWMMNTVWDGLEETRQHYGDILFIEEDHFIYPNAYRNLQILAELRPEKCPDCYAANLAPSVVFSRGEHWENLVAERMGNVGYAFNHSVWRKIHEKAREFCLFDDYNWDITMWAAVYPSFGGPVYTLRGPRTSAVHFGECGLHQQPGEKAKPCIDDGVLDFEVEDIDTKPNVRSDWRVFVWKQQEGYSAGFKGWGGWGDIRDHQLCLDFAKLYQASEAV